MDVGDEKTDESGYDTGPPTAYSEVSEALDTAVVLPPPLEGRLLDDPVGLQISKPRTRIGFSPFLPSAMMARPLNSLPFRCPVSPIVSYRTQMRDNAHHLGKVVCRTERRVEVVASLDPHPPRRAFLEDFHMVYVADLSYIVLDLLPRNAEWELQVSGQ